jgi:hypothetical protein
MNFSNKDSLLQKEDHLSPIHHHCKKKQEAMLEGMVHRRLPYQDVYESL